MIMMMIARTLPVLCAGRKNRFDRRKEPIKGGRCLEASPARDSRIEMLLGGKCFDKQWRQLDA